MKKNLLTIISIAGGLAAVGAVVPDDGAKIWRRVIDASMPEEYSAGGIVDLSDASVVKAFSTVYRVFGDSLVCRSVPGMRDWFVLREGALWRVGANDRVTRHAHSHGVMYLPVDFSPLVRTATDSLTVTPVDSDPEMLAVSSSLSVAPGPAFILNYGDTIPRTVEVTELTVRTAPSGASLTTCSRRWYAEGCAVPVVEESGIVSGGELYATLTVCPPDEQPRADIPESRGRGMFGAPPLPEEGGDGCIEIVSCDGLLSVGERDATIYVCDLQGRVMRSGTGSVATAGLPPGWYIISASTSAGGGAVKFRID